MPSDLSKTRQKLNLFKFDHFGHRLSKEILINEDEIFCKPLGSREPGCFLGVATPAQMDLLLQRHQVFAGLKKLGIEKPVFEFNSKNGFDHRLRVLAHDQILIEAMLHKTALPLHQPTSVSAPDILFVEWLMLQNPFREFDEQRPQLPGQRHPGLGLSKEVLGVLIELTKMCGLVGLAAVPGHYHNAAIFSKSFKYLNPECEGKLGALRRDLAGYPLDVISWAVELDCVKRAGTDDYLKWFIDWQVLGLSDALIDYFFAEDYKVGAEKILREYHFVLDDNKFETEKSRIPQLAEVII